MPSPFPGMDPYLEADAIWPAFHHQMIAGLYQILLPGLVDRYRARVQERRYVMEVPLFTSVIREEHCEEYLEIRQRGDGRTITVIEVVSPGNKLTPQGRDAYHETRRRAKARGANVVEIDLSMQGEPMLDYSREGLPDWDHAVTVTRATAPERYEIYTTTLRKRLPRFKVPLAADDRDTVLDLQATFTRCFDQGDFGVRVDYASDPPITMDSDDLEWTREWLQQQRVR